MLPYDIIRPQWVNIITSGHFYLYGLTLIPVWISIHTPSKVWDEITYPFLNFNDCTIKFRNG